MGIKVVGSSTTMLIIRHPFMWRNNQDHVFIRRDDGQDASLTTGRTSPGRTSDAEAWSMRLNEVTLRSD